MASLNRTGRIAAFCMIGLCTLPGSSFADDAALSVAGGTVHPMEEHPSIQMTGEDVEIRLRRSGYDVHAKFEFWNTGTSTSLAVGFPQHCRLRDVPQMGDFKDFRALVNGMDVQTREVILPQKTAEPEDARCLKWKVKDVEFPSKSKVQTEVYYTAPYGYYSVGHTKFVSYEISTGGSWYGPIGTSTFTIHHAADTVLQLRKESPFAYGSGIGAARSSHTETTAKWVVDPFEPSPSEMIWLDVTWQEQPWEKDLDDPQFAYASRPIETDLLKKLSRQQLRLLRNEFYARHGRIFENSEIRDYFESKRWYSPREDFTLSELSAMELANVEAIAQHEKALK